MATLLGELIGRVEAAPVIEHEASRRQHDDEALAGLVAEINRVVDPPVAVAASGVFIRAMEVISDEVNEHGGRFSPDEFARLCELIIDSPVLVAHDRRQLPVARNFKAAVVERDGRPWVKVWFYWPKDAAGAQDLASRIDSGVIREVSIGFEFKCPECSVCGADIRQCEHRPFGEYRHADGSVRPAHYLYRDIVRVLETSLVYRGATPGTRIGAGLFFTKGNADAGGSAADSPLSASVIPAKAGIHENEMMRGTISGGLRKQAELLFDLGLANGIPIASLSDLPLDGDCATRFVVTPLIDGLPVVALKCNDDVFLFDRGQHEIGDKFPALCRELKRLPVASLTAFGWLVRSHSGRRGSSPWLPKAIFSVEWLGVLGNEDFTVRPVIEHRRKLAVLFKTCPGLWSGGGKLIRPAPYRWADRRTLDRVVTLLGSRAGCRIFPAGLVSARFFELRRPAYLWAQVIEREAAPDGAWRYRLALRDGQELCEIADGVSSYQRYEIGCVVRLTGTPEDRDGLHPRLVDPKLLYTPARRNLPDGIQAIQVLSQSACGSPAPPAPGRRRAVASDARRFRIAQ